MRLGQALEKKASDRRSAALKDALKESLAASHPEVKSFARQSTDSAHRFVASGMLDLRTLAAYALNDTETSNTVSLTIRGVQCDSRNERRSNLLEQGE